MVVLRAIGRFFVRIGRWIKDTAWIQPLLIVGGIFAIIFSIPHLTKWVKSWFTDTSAAEKYFSSKKVSLKNADKDHGSDVDVLFDYLTAFKNGEEDKLATGEKKFGKKFFLTLVQEECADCESRYGAFETLEKNWNSGSLTGLDGEFKFHTIYVDTKNDNGENLFEKVYDRDTVTELFENLIPYMAGDAGAEHPYRNNISSPDSYISNLGNLTNREEISTPTTFLIDLTENAPEWTSEYGVREVLFSFDGINGSDNIAKARTLHDAWINYDKPGDGRSNIFSPEYKKI